MGLLPNKLYEKLSQRETTNSLRSLAVSEGLVDFSSNDYLGFAGSREIFDKASKILEQRKLVKNGATGSRLLSGNNKLYEELEEMLARFHNSEAALVFNSGYDANVGFFASVPQRGDSIFHDELIHASIRDGIRLGNANSYKFKHNDLDDLKSKISQSLQGQSRNPKNEIYVVTESVFSMNGDTPNLKAFVEFCEVNNCHLVVDEAHAFGVYGSNGSGLLQELDLQRRVFARIVTFGKALGCHGAVILGSIALKKYLVNFARSFIYTTAMPPHSLATILAAYEHLSKISGKLTEREMLIQNIYFFNQQLEKLNLKQYFTPSTTAIHCCIVPGNEKVRAHARELNANGFDVRPILSPTVPAGEERLRFCLHSYNSKKEIVKVLELLANFKEKI